MVLFATIFFSFSLAAYIYLTVIIFLNLWIEKKEMFRKLAVTVALLIIAVTAAFTYNGGNNLVHDLILLPQEIQYQITYTVQDQEIFQRCFSQEAGRPSFCFVSVDAESGEMALMNEGIGGFSEHGPDEAGVYVQSGSLGRSAVSEEYTLGVFTFRELLEDAPRPLDTAGFRVEKQSPGAYTPEEEAWRQQSERQKTETN